MSKGVFDKTAINLGWFDETTQDKGWFDETLLNVTSTSSQTLTQSARFDNSNSFFTHTLSVGGITLSASLFSNTNAVYSPTVLVGDVTLTVSLFSNSQTFYNHTVSNAASSQTLTQTSIFTNGNIFYSPTVTSLSLTTGDLQAIAESVWTKVIESFTAEEMYRVMFSGLVGKRIGMGTATEYYMGVDGTTPRIEFLPTDNYGNGEPILNGDIIVTPPTITGVTLSTADLNAISNSVWARAIETFTAEEMHRVMFAALAGKRVGMGTATEYYMGVDGVTPRIEFSPTDAAGNGDPILNGDP